MNTPIADRVRAMQNIRDLGRVPFLRRFGPRVEPDFARHAAERPIWAEKPPVLTREIVR